MLCLCSRLQPHLKVLALQEAGRGIIAGSILLPELDLSGNHAQPQLGDKGCYMYLVPPEAIGAGQQGPAGAASCRGHLAPAMAQLQINGGSAQPDKLGTLIVPCQYPVPPERAMLWAQEMSSSVQALLTMVLGSIPVGASWPVWSCHAGDAGVRCPEAARELQSTGTRAALSCLPC